MLDLLPMIIFAPLSLLLVSCGGAGLGEEATDPERSFITVPNNPKIGIIYDGSLSQQKIIELALKKAKFAAESAVLAISNSPEETSKAIDKLIQEEAINVFITAGNSTEETLQALKSIQEKPAIIISPSSTAPLLETPDDQLFRLAPSDTEEASALVNQYITDSIQYVVSFTHRNLEGIMLENALDTQLALKPEIKHDHYFYDYGYYSGPTPTEPFSSDILEFAVGKEVQTHETENNKVALQLFVGKGEMSTILELASKIPTLANVKLYTSNASVGSSGFSAITPNATATQFAIERNLQVASMTPVLNQDEQIAQKEVLCSLKKDLPPGEEISRNALTLVDSIGLGAKIAKQTAGKSVCLDDFKNITRDLAGATKGITGPLKLNSNGDRAPTDKPYAFLTISSEPPPDPCTQTSP